MKKRNLPALLLLTILPVLTQAQKTWTNSFDIVIFNQSIPSVSPSSITIIPKLLDVVASKTISLSNTGNKPAGFTIGGIPPGFLTPTLTAGGWQDLDENVYDPTGLPVPVPNPLSIGFSFPFFGKNFTTVKVDPRGFIDFDSSNQLRIFNHGGMTTSTENIRYLRETDRFVVSWVGANIPANQVLIAGLNNLEFQIQLYKSGEIRYVYQNMDGAVVGDASVGYTGAGSSFVPLDFDGEESVSSFDNQTVILNQQSWFSTSAEANPVGPVSTNALTLLVDNIALNKLNLNGKLINLTVNWDDGSSDAVAVTVIRQTVTNKLEVLPSTLNLPQNAPLGVVTVTNSGNSKLSYSIYNSNAETQNNYQWGISEFTAGETLASQKIVFEDRKQILGPVINILAAADFGVSEMIPIGFGFPYFGKVYTNFSVNVDGFIALGESAKFVSHYSKVTTRSWTVNDNDFVHFSYGFENYVAADEPGAVIAPFMNDWSQNDSGGIYVSGDDKECTITWLNMIDADNPPDTFHLTLNKNGNITFSYTTLHGANWVGPNLDWNKALEYLSYTRLYEYFGGYYPPRFRDNDPEPAPPPFFRAIGLRYNNIYVETDLVWSKGTDSVAGTTFTNFVITETDIPVGDNEHGAMVLVTNPVVVYNDPINSQAFTFEVSKTTTPFSFSPIAGSLMPGKTQAITVDARGRTAGTSGTYTIVPQAGPSPSFTVNVTAASPAPLMDSDFDGQSDSAEILAGTDLYDASSTFTISSASSVNADGSQTIAWTAPSGDLPRGRTYTIWYTTNLMDRWQLLDTVSDVMSYTDTKHSDVPAIYYKVTID